MGSKTNRNKGLDHSPDSLELYEISIKFFVLFPWAPTKNFYCPVMHLTQVIKQSLQHFKLNFKKELN